MSVQVKTTKQIADNIIASLSASFNQTIPWLPRAFNAVLAKALASIWVILYKYGGFIFLQIFVETASSKETEINGKKVIPLVFWGRLIGVGDPVPAVNAELTVDIVVENQTGILKSGSQGVNAAGVTYITTADVALTAPVVQVVVKAVNDQADNGGAGVIGNMEPGEIITFANPIPNVAKEMTVVNTVVTGADGEDIDTTYRQRVIDRFKKRPQGGSYADYELWGEETEGVIHVYPYTSLPGQIDLYSEVAASIDPDGIPNAATLLAVKENVEKNENGRATRRPALAWINSFPIDRQGFDTDIIGLEVEDLVTTTNDIINALNEFYFTREPFIDGLTVFPKTNTIDKTGLISIVDQIVKLNNGTFDDVIFRENGEIIPLDEYTLQDGQKAKSSVVSIL